MHNLSQHVELLVKKNGRKFLGMTIEISSSGTLVKVLNAPLVDHALARFGMQHCAPVVTRMVPNTELQAAQGDYMRQKVPYRELIGIILHLANNCCPDTTYSVSYLSGFLDKFGMEH